MPEGARQARPPAACRLSVWAEPSGDPDRDHSDGRSPCPGISRRRDSLPSAPENEGGGGRYTSLFLLLAAAALIIGLAGAWALRWVCDDSFITFRYVDNLLDGKGLVYNAGERVEGYSHFLWLCLLIPLRAAGMELPAAAQALGLVCFAALLCLAAWISYRLFPRTRPIIPFTALALALHPEVRIWATGGLETMLCALEILGAVALASVIRTERPLRHLGLGLVLTLSLLTRPDAVVFAALTLAFVGLKDRFRPLLLTLIPFLLLVPYAVWKLLYFGRLLPNPYYAKSAGLTYYRQGLLYLWIYFRPYLSSGLALLGFPYLLWLALGRGGSGSRDSCTWRERWRALLQDPVQATLLLAWTLAFGYAFLFVARVGGDFMYARFLIPVIPLFYLCLEILVHRLLPGPRLARTLVLLLLPVVLLLERRSRDALFFKPSGEAKNAFGVSGITDERWYYTHRVYGFNLTEANEIIGRRLHDYFDDRRVCVLLRGQAALGYYGRFTTCIENAGLTDATIAAQPAGRQRGRPGHEKSAPYDYLIRRGVNFVFQKPPYRDDPYRTATFQVGAEPVKAEIISYDRSLMRYLGERFPRAVRFTDFEQYLDQWIRTMDRRSPEQNRAEYERFQDYYFHGGQDPERESEIVQRLAGK